MNRLKRIAAIHDLSGAGKCSLTAALPIISAAGVECSCIPTAILSTHTGEFTNYVFRDLTDMLLPIAEHWLASGFEFDGIYSGYLATPAQAAVLGEIIGLLATGAKIIIDPVMADNGAFYASLDAGMTEAFRGLCSRADLLTPNVTEAALLTGITYEPPPHGTEYVKRLTDALLDLGAKAVALTGIQLDGKTVGNAVAKRGMAPIYETRPLVGGVFYGTGDIFASAMAALLVKGADERTALKIATALVDSSVKNTAARGTPRRFGADFETALPDFIADVRREGLLRGF